MQAEAESACEIEGGKGSGLTGPQCERLEQFENFVRQMVGEGHVVNFITTLQSLSHADQRRLAKELESMQPSLSVNYCLGLQLTNAIRTVQPCWKPEPAHLTHWHVCMSGVIQVRNNLCSQLAYISMHSYCVRLQQSRRLPASLLLCQVHPCFCVTDVVKCCPADMVTCDFRQQ